MKYYLPGYCCLIGRNAPLKEVCQLLNILQFHERKRVPGMEYGSDSQPLQPGVCHVPQVLAHITHGKSGDTSTQQIFRKLCFRVDRFMQHLHYLMLKLPIPQIRLLAAYDIDYLEGKFQVATLVAEDPIGAGGKTMQQSLRAQEVNIGERRKDLTTEARSWRTRNGPSLGPENKNRWHLVMSGGYIYIFDSHTGMVYIRWSKSFEQHG